MISAWSVFERIARFQPRRRSSASASGTSGNGGQSGSERASAPVSPSGIVSSFSVASRSSVSVSTSA